MSQKNKLEDLLDYCTRQAQKNDRMFSNIQGYSQDSKEERCIYGAKSVAYTDIAELIQVCLDNLKEA